MLKKLLTALLITTLLCCFAQTTWAAGSTNTVWEIRSTATASNVNCGGFDIGNTHFLTDGAATSATGASPVFTSASYNFQAGDVGAWIYISAGTNWTPGFYKI